MKSVIKGTGYILVHTPDMILQNGTTWTTEKIVNPESELLKEAPNHLRDYETVVSYYPNQTYIGNTTPDELAGIEAPWYDKKAPNASRYGKFGEIMPQEEFLLLIQTCDVFDLVKLDKNFVAATKPAFAANEIISEDIVARVVEGIELSEIEHLVKDEHSEPLFHNSKLVGCVKRAHDIDVNLSAHVMHENLISKASSVLSLLYAVKNAGIEKSDVEYVLDCCEEAAGDMNQRGGCNFAKAAAEIAGLQNASGADMRGFCAAPAHTIIAAASLVASGAYNCVAVTSGGCTAKLGMNGKDHIKKGMPILEDMIGGFAVIITKNDGVSPIVDLSVLGRHTVGTGSAPQNVIASLVQAPLNANGMKIIDIDRYSPEMQNPDITKPAGAGDVPLANYKMIGALAVKSGEMDKSELAQFPTKHGLVGWAPTQGHIPSGVPYIGFACDDLKSGKIKNAMIIGKGSLFLGRMTNLFDGVSFVMRANTGATEEAAVSEDKIRSLISSSLRDFANSLLSQED